MCSYKQKTPQRPSHLSLHGHTWTVLAFLDGDVEDLIWFSFFESTVSSLNPHRSLPRRSQEWMTLATSRIDILQTKMWKSSKFDLIRCREMQDSEETAFSEWMYDDDAEKQSLVSSEQVKRWIQIAFPWNQTEKQQLWLVNSFVALKDWLGILSLSVTGKFLNIYSERARTTASDVSLN